MKKQILLMVGCGLIGGFGAVYAGVENDMAGQKLQKKGHQQVQKQGFRKPRFIDLDLNGDTFITLAEFKESPIPHGEHETIFGHIDSDGNGEITPEEFKSHRPPRLPGGSAKRERASNG